MIKQSYNATREVDQNKDKVHDNALQSVLNRLQNLAKRYEDIRFLLQDVERRLLGSGGVGDEMREGAKAGACTEDSYYSNLVIVTDILADEIEKINISVSRLDREI